MLCKSSYWFGYTRDADDVLTMRLFNVISDMYVLIGICFGFLLLFFVSGTVRLPVVRIHITDDVNDMYNM